MGRKQREWGGGRGRQYVAVREKGGDRYRRPHGCAYYEPQITMCHTKASGH